ncbi:Ubiquitin fusion degradation protein Ufd1-like [Dillenia turbinata]|uniref:Ubiquitin fusion degradation protein Ufd1-like n=1 Tax=Dillenia turbinata TaxID=194707 RepID=A0AAN8ZJ13_9MAGN
MNMSKIFIHSTLLLLLRKKRRSRSMSTIIRRPRRIMATIFWRRRITAMTTNWARFGDGDNILMPASALDRLARAHIEYSVLFGIQNCGTKEATRCGVLEFTADEGSIHVPTWMMQNLGLQEGDPVKVKNPGDDIKVLFLFNRWRHHHDPFQQQKFYINIVETKPSSAISILETDCEVEFCAPLDYKEPEKKPSPPKVFVLHHYLDL